MTNPYQTLVLEYNRLFQEGKRFPLGNFPPAAQPSPRPGAPKVLIFSPHPDDECIVGGLPLRLQRQSGMNVINVAVTQGSKKDRQAERWRELQNACRYLGYGLIQTAPAGLEKVNPAARDRDPAFWTESVRVIAEILKRNQPRIVFFPHERDWNSTHIGTHLLVTDALRSLGPEFRCFTVETEYWGQMTDPNLMVESSPQDVADLVTGTSFHVGEVRRNPFHLLQPAWMQDNIRRGSELVGGQGEGAPDFAFATLYKLRHWAGGAFDNFPLPQKTLSHAQNPDLLFSPG